VDCKSLFESFAKLEKTTSQKTFPDHIILKPALKKLPRPHYLEACFEKASRRKMDPCLLELLFDVFLMRAPG